MPRALGTTLSPYSQSSPAVRQLVSASQSHDELEPVTAAWPAAAVVSHSETTAETARNHVTFRIPVPSWADSASAIPGFPATTPCAVPELVQST